MGNKSHDAYGNKIDTDSVDETLAHDGDGEVEHASHALESLMLKMCTKMNDQQK